MGKLAQKLSGQSQSQIQTKKEGGKVKAAPCAMKCGGKVGKKK